MSGVTAMQVIAAGAIAAAGASAYGAYEQHKAGNRQERAAKEQLAQAERLKREEDQARNKANQKEADIGGLLGSNTVEGLGSTTLTGSTGAAVDPNKLGKGNNLLGQ